MSTRIYLVTTIAFRWGSSKMSPGHAAREHKREGSEGDGHPKGFTRFPCVSYVIIISLIFKTVRSGVFLATAVPGDVGWGQCNYGIFSRPKTRVAFLSDQGMVHVDACGMLRCDFDTVGTAKKMSQEAAYQNAPSIFCVFFLLKVFTQVDPSILTDFTSPSTLNFHRQSQISRFSTRTLGSVCDLSRSLFLIDTNWHWHVETRRIDLIETRRQCGSNSMLFCCPRITSKWEFSWCRTNSHPKSDGHGVSILRVFLTNCVSLPSHWVHKLERKLQLPHTAHTWNSSLQKRYQKLYLESGPRNWSQVGTVSGELAFCGFSKERILIEVKFKVPFYFLKRLSVVLMSVVGL